MHFGGYNFEYLAVSHKSANCCVTFYSKHSKRSKTQVRLMVGRLEEFI
ncbi:MAG: hypothetical protein BWY08_01947 [Bacteroidetes bacterium ADurb.Bin174]|nr:MAG: hypothetical protein BWY08_01947 [Bacteroidetes bacterium ADurb.Bin174]